VLRVFHIIASLFNILRSFPDSIMPNLFPWSRSKSKSTSKINNTGYQYTAIGPGHIRLLRYVPSSKGSKINLQIQVFDRRTKPRYAALSYVWGEKTPRQTISLEGCRFDTGPNLYNALRSMRKGLPEWFWIDAICIDQNNISERNEQVREMTETYAKATFVASWIGLCDELIRPVFSLDVRTQNLSNLPPPQQRKLTAALRQLCQLEYWTRIWIQQELLLNPNIVLFCGEFMQPLHPLIEWSGLQGRSLILQSDLFHSLETGSEWVSWRKAPVLRLLTWAGYHQSTDVRDKLFALLSLVVEHEREALLRYFPDYDLSLAQVIMVTIVHIRRCSGQRRAAQQLDSVLLCFGDPGDSACAVVVRSYFGKLRDTAVGANGQQSCRLPARERNALQSRTLLGGKVNMLDICDCIFSWELGSTAGRSVDVRSSRTWQRSGTWVFDLPLSKELDEYWAVSFSK
jgi:hypothetical protein